MFLNILESCDQNKNKGKVVYRRAQMNAIALQKLTLDWANLKIWTNLNFAMLAIVLKSVVTVRRN